MSEKMAVITIDISKFKGDLTKIISKIKNILVWDDDIDIEDVDVDWYEEEISEDPDCLEKVIE